METVATVYCKGKWAHIMSFGIHGRFFEADAAKCGTD